MSTNHVKPILSLKNFCSKMIDYAGLFPPARLELGQAFHNFVFYSQSEFKWMLGKFMIPIKKLVELGSILDDMKIKGEVSLSVLGSGGESINEFDKNFSEDISTIKDFIFKYSSTISIDAFEVRLPKELFEKDDNDEMLDMMISISAGLEVSLGIETPVFYEVTLSENYEQEIIRAVETIASLDNGCGYKLRTGGTEPAAFPKPEVIAFAIMTCCEFNVPMKCTAGLHHPIRHYNEEVKANMHGFMNVFAAGILAYTYNLDEEELLEVLNDDDPYQFIFADSSFVWNELEVSSLQITEARDNFMLSYGSCSFDDPIEDLKTMEFLKQ